MLFWHALNYLDDVKYYILYIKVTRDFFLINTFLNVINQKNQYYRVTSQ